MYSLLIDTHSSEVLLILFKDGKIIANKNVESNQSHSIIAMPLLKELLAENNLEVSEINEIIVVNGPGSFTGVRIGVTIAKTISYCLSIPIKCISSLEVLAFNLGADNEKTVALNDRNGYFIGEFDSNNSLLKDYFYLSNKEFVEYSKNNKIDVSDNINYEKVYSFAKEKKTLNPHLVNPIYVKKIEVQK